MRIIYVTSTLPHGPGEPFIIPEVRELIRRGHEILLVPMNPRDDVVHEDAEELLGLTVSQPVVSASVLMGAAVSTARNPIAAIRVAGSLFKSRNGRILFKNLAVLPKGLWLARLARSWKADHIHAHWAACTSTIAYAASKVSGIPWSLTAHRWDISENNLLDLKARSARFVRAINRNGVMALREFVHGDGFDPVVIHMGVLVPPLIDAHPQRTGQMRGLMAGNLVEVKGHVYLMQAMSRLVRSGVEVCLDVAGSGPLQAELERLTRELEITDSVRFLGQLSHRDLLQRLDCGDWDFVVLPSIHTVDGEHEGTPVILMEAMSYGIPVISTLTGGIPELLDDGAGVLVPDKDPDSLAAAIQQVAQDPALRARLGEACRRRVEESFSIPGIIDELERRFSSCQP